MFVLNQKVLVAATLSTLCLAGCAEAEFESIPPSAVEEVEVLESPAGAWLAVDGSISACFTDEGEVHVVDESTGPDFEGFWSEGHLILDFRGEMAGSWNGESGRLYLEMGEDCLVDACETFSLIPSEDGVCMH